MTNSVWKKLASGVFVSLIAGSLLFISGCSEDDDDQADLGFAAQIEDLQNYLNWNKSDYAVLPTNQALLGPAHAGNDPAMTREIWENIASGSDGNTYGRGTIFVKETHGWTSSGGKVWPAAGGKLAMVKRGGDFNPDGGGWEYFMLNDAGTEILARGADLMDGACMNCHAAAGGMVGKDYIFAHPASVDPVSAGGEWTFFNDWPNWERVDSTYGPDPFLGAAHGINDDFSRETFRWQPGARLQDSSFPVGTVLLKVVSNMNGGQREFPPAGGMTAMVKRGGSFDDSRGDWEWFMLSHQDNSVLRGNGAAMNMCVTCHSSATGSNGGDWVFSHPGLGN